MKFKRFSLTALGTVTTCAGLAVFTCAGPARAEVSSQDARFMRGAAMGGLGEVRLGELAVRRGNSERVRNFGQRMIDDHTRANDDLKSVAEHEGVSLPDHLNRETRVTLDRLERLHGSAFDAAYISAMRTDHSKDVADFRNEARNGQDPDVRDFAKRTLPIVQEHSRMINAMNVRRNWTHARHYNHWDQ